jgi:hypothetical protein
MAMPSSWAEVLARAAVVLGGGPVAAAEADEGFRQALTATYGSRDALTGQTRALAFQRACGTVFALEDIGDGGMLPLHDDPRAEVRAVFARYWDGLMLDGPPWRLSPREDDRARWAPPPSSDFDDQEVHDGNAERSAARTT